MNTIELEKKIIQNGINNLKEFGYVDVDEKNILTDMIYSAFFKKMLKENLGYDKIIDIAINKLINKIGKTVDE